MSKQEKQILVILALILGGITIGLLFSNIYIVSFFGVYLIALFFANLK